MAVLFLRPFSLTPDEGEKRRKPTCPGALADPGRWIGYFHPHGCQPLRFRVVLTPISRPDCRLSADRRPAYAQQVLLPGQSI
ncbi:unnamed protein product [Protopolystoma xenopodis]|uniref:Uncharacterized protein n=1 Tax=Protopolystoma xenopodis TaxID=117903 RepID=A0A3S5BE86_9PLAT|nr:unnamed protein product [Protopolystoma xenopodis]